MRTCACAHTSLKAVAFKSLKEKEENVNEPGNLTQAHTRVCLQGYIVKGKRGKREIERARYLITFSKTCVINAYLINLAPFGSPEKAMRANVNSALILPLLLLLLLMDVFFL